MKFKKTLMAKIVDNFEIKFVPDDIAKFELQNLTDIEVLNEIIQTEFELKSGDISTSESEIKGLSNSLDDQQKKAEKLQLDYESKYHTL